MRLRARNVRLVSLALGLPCCGGSDGGTGDDSPGSEDANGDDAAGTGHDLDSGTGGEASGTGGEDEDGVCGTGGYERVCGSYGQRAFECGVIDAEPEDIEGFCREILNYYYHYAVDVQCAAAFLDLFACLSPLDCREFASGDACGEQSAAVGMLCFDPAEDTGAGCVFPEAP